MDITTINEFINTMGFPVVMVIYFIWDKNKGSKQLIETISRLEDTLQHNTTVLEKLLTKLGLDGDTEK